jgi:hypothetical protein
MTYELIPKLSVHWSDMGLLEYVDVRWGEVCKVDEYWKGRLRGRIETRERRGANPPIIT